MSVLTTVTVVQQVFVGISCAGSYPNRAKNVDGAGVFIYAVKQSMVVAVL